MPPINFSKLIHYQSQLPASINVRIGRSKDGGCWVKILSLPGCFTQAKDAEELFVMVNDAVFTYFDIPESYFSFLPRYFPTEKIRKKLQTWGKCDPIKFPRSPITITFFPQMVR